VSVPQGTIDEIREATVLVDGVRVRYSQAGAGPALVLVHGLVGSAHNWNRNIRFLAQFRTVYALNLANAGASERVAGLDAGLEAQAHRVLRSMDELGIQVADVGGHSHGGAIAMILAARHPDRVRRLVLFAPANPYCTLGQAQMRFYATRLGSVFAGWIIPLLPRALHRRSLERMYGDPGRIVEGVLEGYTDGLNRPAIQHVLAIMLRWSEDMAVLEAALPSLTGIATLLVWGDRDRAVALRSGQELARRLGAPLKVVPDAGHIAFEEMPDICNRAVGEWLCA
jgi:4,5:9,10-diseco-3-hydroxy-5,9,17-trioxoandrosta-1(10),2-diene-4-oate hydrolase